MMPRTAPDLSGSGNYVSTTQKVIVETILTRNCWREILPLLASRYTYTLREEVINISTRPSLAIGTTRRYLGTNRMAQSLRLAVATTI